MFYFIRFIEQINDQNRDITCENSTDPRPRNDIFFIKINACAILRYVDVYIQITFAMTMWFAYLTYKLISFNSLIKYY